MDVFFVFFTILFLPAFAEPIPDYNNPYAPIFTDKDLYSWTDKIKMTIISPSWNSDRNLIDTIGGENDHSIKISTNKNSLEPYKFTETGPNTGIFTAEVILTGFSHDVDGDGDLDTTPRTFGNGPTNGFLEVDRDSSVTISFEFADGVVLTKSVPTSWNVGAIYFSNDVFFTNETVIIQVIDFDMNLNPEALDRVLIHVFSDSDVSGTKVSAVETSENSGKFSSKISLSQNSRSSGDRLYSQLGDQIYAKYDDYTLPKPYSTSDNLTLESSARIDSPIPSIQRLKNSNILLTDGFGNELSSLLVNNQLQIVGTLANDYDFTQKFVYLFQVKNASDYVESISWVQGEISPKQRLDVSQSWVPKKPGMYEIETFVWNSLNDPRVLSTSTSRIIAIK